jgi:hypothetical protein
MSHFAKIESGIVTQVIVAEQDFIDTQEDTWKQTSYNTRSGKHYAPNSFTEDGGTPLRKNFAGVGDVYDESKNAFYKPQPYPSWTLNEDTCHWQAPVAYPDDGKVYEWDEAITNWVEIELE